MNKLNRSEMIDAAVQAAGNPNLPDRIVNFFNPVAGRARQQARAAMAMSGGFSNAGASKSRRTLSAWQTTSNDADADLLPDLPLLRQRSRDLVRNNPLATGVLNTKCANVVGTGLWLKSSINAKYLNITPEAAKEWQDKTEFEFRMWCESTDCDIARTLNFYAMQDVAFRSTLENGDTGVLLTFANDRRNSVYKTAVQLIEADRICNPNWQRDNDKIAGGIERDLNGAPKNYHVLRAHPGSVSRTSKNVQWDTIPAFGAKTGRRNMLLLYRTLRIGQSRGMPDLAPVIEALKQLGDYTDAELTAAVVSGLFTVFVKTEAGDSALGSTLNSSTGHAASNADVFKMGTGAVIDLAKGESIDTANPGRPNQAFDPFVQAILRQVGVALELPLELLVLHFTKSYSAARSSLMMAWKFFRNRRAWLADDFCQPIYEAVMWEAVSMGRIVAPGFLQDPAIRAAYLGSEWIGDAPGQIDPLKEAQAAKLMEEMNWKTATENTAELTGGDWDVKVQQRIREQRITREGGVAMPGSMPVVEQAAPPKKPDDEDEDEDDDDETDDK